jgi:TM2 domain-containing membrane protein YozV
MSFNQNGPIANQPEAEADPLVGTQETTDSLREAALAPHAQVAMHEEPHGQSVRSRLVAACLGVLLGGLGAHRFYLGFWRIGWVQLLVTLGPVLIVLAVAKIGGVGIDEGVVLTAVGVSIVGVLWGLIEGVVIFVGGIDRDAQGRPLFSDDTEPLERGLKIAPRKDRPSPALLPSPPIAGQGRHA